MIIAVIGSTSQDVEVVASTLSHSHCIQVVDTLELLRHLDRKTMGSLTTKDYHQKYLLKKLESEFGTVIVTGNIILNEEICKWVLESENNEVVIASRGSLEKYDEETLKYTEKYWEDKASQRYNLEVRFKKTYERLSKASNSEHLYLVDVSEKEHMNLLKSLLTNWDVSSKSIDSYDDIIDLVNPRKDDDTMTMEESIKKAMRELGMDVDDNEVSSETKPSLKKPEKKMKDFMNPPVKEEPKQQPQIEESHEDSTEEDEQEDSIFVKITDDTMALLIPESIHLKSQEISGMKFNVATVSLPDLKDRKLQELTVITGEVHSNQVERTPIISKKEKETKKLTKVVVVSGNLVELQEEKSRLDAEIKKARAEGDIDAVNALRKQRRAVRNKINSLK